MQDTIRKRILIFLYCLAAMPVFSQAGADSLQQLFTRYQLNTFQEKLFVHINKTFYLAGETAWYKVYDIDGWLHRPCAASAIAHVEILDKDQRPLVQARILLQEGSGNGSLLIPTSIASGHYRLRAYTSWMRNFSPDFYYEQTITIVNTLRAPAAPAPSGAPVYAVQFFPEGGNLVAGLASRTAFKITNRYGQGLPGRGIIINSRKDTVARFETGHAGMGSFLFTPQQDETYTALVNTADTVLRQSLPMVYAQGYTMRLVDKDEGHLQVIVSASPSLAALPVYLLAHTRQLVKSMETGIPAVNGQQVFIIDKNKLGEGISHVTVFNAARQPVCERLYFKRPAAKLLVAAHLDQAVYGTRKKINIAVSAEDRPGHAADADMSMAVFMVDSLQSPHYTDMLSWLLLSSDIKGAIEDPGWYLDNTRAESDTAIDNLLLTQGWRRFRWEDVLQNRLPLFEYLPEKEGPVINARLTDRRSGRPAGNATAWLSVPGQHFVLATASARPGGDTRFNLDNFYGRNEIIVQTNPLTDSLYKVDIASPWSDKFSTNPLPVFRLWPQWKDQLEYRSINSQAENSYGLKNRERYILSAGMDTTHFYGPPDKQYYLDEYTRFTSMEEVMREYVAEVRVRGQPGKFSFRVVNDYFKAFFDDDPLVLLDGLPVFDVNKVMAMDPLRVKKIEIVARKYYLGGLTADGIVHFKTYEGDLAGYQLDANAVVVEYDGLQRERAFYAPVYETDAQAGSRIPDTRNALYWAPHIKTGGKSPQQLSFYTGDLKGTFAVVVQGISKDGLAGSTIATFEVR